jgi:preprotein translocase subunit SecD
MTRGSVVSLVVIVLLAVGGLVASISAGNSPQLGLDLQGGVAVILKPTADNVDPDQLDQAIEVIRSRVDSLGVSEPEITRQGNRIVVQLPGVSDANRALELVGKTAELRYRPLLGFDQAFPYDDNGASIVQLLVDDANSPQTLVSPESVITPAEEITPDAEIVLPELTQDALFMLDVEELESSGIESITVIENPLSPGEWGLQLALTEEARPDFQSYVALNIDRQMTLSYDGSVYSLVALGQPEFDFEAPFPGNFTEEQANELVAAFEEDASVVSLRATRNGTLAFEYSEVGAGNISEVFLVQSGETDTPTVTPEEVITPRNEDLFDVSVALPDLRDEQLYALAPAVAKGDIISGANAQLDQQSNGWIVSITFTTEGNAEFNQIAAQSIGRPLAIVLDGVVYSAPTINAASFNGSAIISGSFDEQEAKDLALVLRFGALPIELEQESVQTVSATLGGDALDAGIVAGIVGLFFVGVYMIAYYRILGVVAMLSLSVSGALLWILISWLGETQGLALTLAGATGIIVSIGVQVDSNVVYYERLKEQVRDGRSLRVSASKGFDDAFSTIVKADVGSLIGAGVLYWLTVGPVRGFAFFLFVATLMDLLVSYFFMRPMVIWLARRKAATSERMLGITEPGAVAEVVA